MKERGEIFKKGTLSEDGDIEFWQDGTTTKRLKAQQEETKATLERGWKHVDLSPESTLENKPGNEHESLSERHSETHPRTVLETKSKKAD